MATSRGDAYVSDIRNSTRTLWESYLFLLSQQQEWNAQSYGTTLDAELDPAGPNADVTAAQIGSVIFAAMDGLNQLFSGTLDGQNLPGAQAGNVTEIL